MKQLSFVDYLLQQQKDLLIESEKFNQQQEWEKSSVAIQKWVNLIEPIRQWQEAMFPSELL
jgi:hypothetical protein